MMPSQNDPAFVLMTRPELAKAFRHVALARKTTVERAARDLQMKPDEAEKLLGELESARLVESIEAPLPQLRAFFLTREGFLAQKAVL
jgi:hypothetical protein